LPREGKNDRASKKPRDGPCPKKTAERKGDKRLNLTRLRRP